MRCCRKIVLSWLGLAGLVIVGANLPVWHKPYQDWTDKDAQQIMTNSPWAKQLPMPAATRPGIAVVEPGSNGVPPPTASLGNPSNTTAGTNMSVAANPGSAGPADPSGTHRLPSAQTPSGVAPETPAPEPGRPIHIVWASATPVRLAVLKLQSGPNAPTDGEIERVSKMRENYVIAVVGLGAPDRDTDTGALARDASLSVKGKPVVAAATCQYRRIGNADVYFFRFPRTSLPIDINDRQVEFKLRFGQAEIKHRFDLSNMEYEGKLAL